MDNTIYVHVPVGPSGCGKSSLAAEKMHQYPDMMIVSKDKIREMFYGKYAYKHNFEDVVSAAESYMLLCILSSGYSAFIDEVNLTIERRESLIKDINKFRRMCAKTIKIAGWYFNIGEAFVDTLIKKRFKENKGLEAERWKKIIMDQVACLVPPTREEGFDEIYVIDRDKVTDRSYAKKCYDQQCDYANKIHARVFVPISGVCPKCSENIWTYENVTRSYDTLITGCPHCGWSFCE